MRKPKRSYLEASGTPNYLVINGTSGDDSLIGTSDPTRSTASKATTY